LHSCDSLPAKVALCSPPMAAPGTPVTTVKWISAGMNDHATTRLHRPYEFPAVV